MTVDKESISYGFHGLAPLGEELFASTLPGLRLITNSGAGTDILDIEWFTKNGVYVANTPTAVTKATADGTALMILSAIKNTTEVVAQAKSDRAWREGLTLMGDPEEMVLGIMYERQIRMLSSLILLVAWGRLVNKSRNASQLLA